MTTALTEILLPQVKTKSRNGDPLPSRRRLLAELDRVVRTAAALSPRQHFTNLVRLGIYTRTGKLTKQYGGTDHRSNAR